MAITPEQIDNEGEATFKDEGKKSVVITESVSGRAAGSAALLKTAGSENSRLAKVAVERLLKTEDWESMASTLVPVEGPELQKLIIENGAEVFDGDINNPDTAGKIFVRAYDLPIWSEAINQSEDLYSIPLKSFTSAAPHIADPKGKSIKQLQAAEDQKAEDADEQPRIITPVTLIRGTTLQELQKAEDEAAKTEGRPAKLYVQKHHIARAIKTIREYINSTTILNQHETEYVEWARLAQEDPSIATEFGALLSRIASNGHTGWNTLGQLASNKSMVDTINNLLSAPGSGAKHMDLLSYIEDAKEALKVDSDTTARAAA